MPDPHNPVGGAFGAHIETMNGAVALRLSGELDLAATPQLEYAIASALQAADAGDGLLVDLDRLSFIDAAGVCSIMDGVGSASRSGHPVGVVGAGPAVRRVFELVGMDALLRPETSLVDAEISASIQPADQG